MSTPKQQFQTLEIGAKFMMDRNVGGRIIYARWQKTSDAQARDLEKNDVVDIAPEKMVRPFGISPHANNNYNRAPKTERRAHPSRGLGVSARPAFQAAPTPVAIDETLEAVRAAQPRIAAVEMEDALQQETAEPAADFSDVESAFLANGVSPGKSQKGYLTLEFRKLKVGAFYFPTNSAGHKSSIEHVKLSEGRGQRENARSNSEWNPMNGEDMVFIPEGENSVRENIKPELMQLTK